VERSHFLLLILLQTTAPACSPAANPAQVRTPQSVQGRAPVPEAPTPSENASPLDRAARSVESLENVPDDTLPRATAQALFDLAAAIEPQSTTEAKTIRECARRIAAAEAQANPGLDLAAVKQGLSAILRALEQSGTAPRRPQEYEQSLATLRKAIATLGAALDSSALERRTKAASAFRAASDALALAQGGEPAFAESENVGQDAAPELSREAQLEEARAEVLKLGQTRWINAPLAASSALDALAALLALEADHRLDEQIAAIRFNAERLGRKDISKFGSAGWIKEALSSTLDALDLRSVGREKEVSTWTRSARRAVSGIEARDSLSFQRAAVQDAFRATVDAFLFAMQSAQTPRAAAD
jgi:hypothetical protein